MRAIPAATREGETGGCRVHQGLEDLHAHPRCHTGVDARLVLGHELDVEEVWGIQGDPRLRQQHELLVEGVLQAGAHQRPRGFHKGKGPPADMHPLLDLRAMEQAALRKACEEQPRLSQQQRARGPGLVVTSSLQLGAHDTYLPAMGRQTGHWW